MADESPHARNFSLLSINGTSPEARNNTVPVDSNSSRNSLATSREPSPNLWPPRHASRNASPLPHRRFPSLELQNVQSGMDLRPASRDGSQHAQQRVSSANLRPSSAYGGIPLATNVTSHPAIQSIAAGNVGALAARPQSMALPDIHDDAIFAPPPPLGDPYANRLSSVDSRDSSKSRGRAESPKTSSPAVGPTESPRVTSSPMAGSSPRGDSTPQSSRGRSPGGPFRPSTPTEGKLVKKSWLAGRFHGRSASEASGPSQITTFVVSPIGREAYDALRLFRAQPVTELWNERGNLFIHLFNRGTSSGPSFKLDPSTIVSSKILLSFMRGRLGDSRSVRDMIQDVSSPVDLYLPLSISVPGLDGVPSVQEMENLVAVRNLFAFLVGQVLVGTLKQPSLFTIFNNIAGLLKHYEFSSPDGSTLGDAPAASFLGYVNDLHLDDVRISRQRTLEALILGERMKCWKLYNEAYVHGVGKWDDLVEMKSPLFDSITSVTRKRMEKSAHGLNIRLKNMKDRLEDFEVPSLFAGVAASSATAKIVDTRTWKASWLGMRKHIMSLYKHRYGAWPPKAKSKKNNFEESGLNRVLLQEVYQDFSDLYDMLVDRTALTTRSADIAEQDDSLSPNPLMQTLRRLLSEFDRSTPPVQPPIPYDIPLLLDLASTRRDFAQLPAKKQVKERNKRLRDDEINMALMQSYNRESVKATPFLEAFMAYERVLAHGNSINELVEFRIGQWIFLYVVLQSLPMVVVDAPGLRWTQGVEYFLCQVPTGLPPWTGRVDGNEMVGVSTALGQPSTGAFPGAGPSGFVSPSVDVGHSVDGVYERSHCWLRAAQWSQGQSVIGLQMSQHTRLQPAYLQSNLIPPPRLVDPDGYQSSSSRASSPASATGSSQRNSYLGFEPLIEDGSPVARKTTADPGKSFEDILGSAAANTVPVKKKRLGGLGG